MFSGIGKEATKEVVEELIEETAETTVAKELDDALEEMSNLKIY